jgi:YidC/Oxa1 family membrane protein insertase
MSSAPGGFLPPLDPNQQSGSSMTRVALTATLMLMAWMGLTIFGPKPPPPTEKPAETPVVAQPTPEPPTSPDGQPLQGTSDQLPEQTVTVAADVEAKQQASKVQGGFEGVLSSFGAQITRWSLTGYFETKVDAEHKDAAQHTKVDIAKGENQGAHLLALRSRGGDVALKADAPWELVEQGPNKAVFSRLTPSGVRLTRSYVVDDAHFSMKIETTLKNEGSEKRTAELDMVLVGRERKGERDEGGMFVVATDKLGGACVTSEDRHTFQAKKVEDDPEDHVWKETIRSAAIDRHYFVGAVTFDGVPTEGCKASTWKKSDDDRGLDVVVSLAPIPLAAGEVKSFAQEAYLGPKQIDALQAFGHGMEDAIDFGMLAVLSRPLLWLLVQIEAQVHDYGLAIIGLTLCIFLITLPLTHRSMVEMKKFGKVMKDLKPELDKIKDKYGHDQRLMVEKQQAFFAEKGVNPFANLMGCLPMLISMPVWIALYRTLSTAVELYQQPFSYLPNILDLTQADTILFGWPLLPFIVCGLMLVSTLQQPPPEDQPQMKYMMYGMPVFFLFIMFNMASGLSIYMITNSLLRMAQSYYIKVKHG